jgi:hypothetical protein
VFQLILAFQLELFGDVDDPSRIADAGEDLEEREELERQELEE